MSKNHTFVPQREVLMNDELSTMGKFVLIEILSKPDHWQCWASDLARRAQVSQPTLARIKDDLIQAGYVRWNSGASQGKSRWWVRESKHVDFPSGHARIARLRTPSGRIAYRSHGDWGHKIDHGVWKDPNLTPGEKVVLQILLSMHPNQRKRVTISTLTRYIKEGRSFAQKTLASLEAKGYVVRASVPGTRGRLTWRTEVKTHPRVRSEGAEEIQRRAIPRPVFASHVSHEVREMALQSQNPAPKEFCMRSSLALVGSDHATQTYSADSLRTHYVSTSRMAAPLATVQSDLFDPEEKRRQVLDKKRSRANEEASSDTTWSRTVAGVDVESPGRTPRRGRKRRGDLDPADWDAALLAEELRERSRSLGFASRGFDVSRARGRMKHFLGTHEPDRLYQAMVSWSEDWSGHYNEIKDPINHFFFMAENYYLTGCYSIRADRPEGLEHSTTHSVYVEPVSGPRGPAASPATEDEGSGPEEAPGELWESLKHRYQRGPRYLRSVR